MKLKELQERFDRALSQDWQALEFLIADNPRLSPQQSIAIYRNNRHAALTRALQTIYPACRRILGDNCFAQLARDYTAEHPSHDNNLNHYGEYFADFLATVCSTQKAWGEFANLPDLAGLEQRCHQAHYAEDDSVLSVEELAAVTEDQQAQLVLQASHSLSLFSSPWPVCAIRDANLQDEQPPSSVQALENRAYWLIHRKPPVEVHTISRRHHDILDAILKGDNLGTLSARFGKLDMLSDWMWNKKWLQGFRLPMYNGKPSQQKIKPSQALKKEA